MGTPWKKRGPRPARRQRLERLWPRPRLLPRPELDWLALFPPLRVRLERLPPRLLP